MSRLRQLATAVLLATVLLVVLLGARPISPTTILAGYALALAAIALAGLTGAIREGRQESPSRFEHELTRRRERPGRPPELLVVERTITLGASNAGHFHARLRPLLWSIAEARSRSPRTELDAATYELLRPDRPPPADAHAPGVALRRLAKVVETLERL